MTTADKGITSRFLSALTGAVRRTLQSKAADSVNIKDFEQFAMELQMTLRHGLLQLLPAVLTRSRKVKPFDSMVAPKSLHR